MSDLKQNDLLKVARLTASAANQLDLEGLYDQADQLDSMIRLSSTLYTMPAQVYFENCLNAFYENIDDHKLSIYQAKEGPDWTSKSVYDLSHAHFADCVKVWENIKQPQLMAQLTLSQQEQALKAIWQIKKDFLAKLDYAFYELYEQLGGKNIKPESGKDQSSVTLSDMIGHTPYRLLGD